ncbi:hypothetical protein Trydic_g964 [Trypoxylus dichotomus]
MKLGFFMRIQNRKNNSNDGDAYKFFEPTQKVQQQRGYGYRFLDSESLWSLWSQAYHQRLLRRSSKSKRGGVSSGITLMHDIICPRIVMLMGVEDWFTKTGFLRYKKAEDTVKTHLNKLAATCYEVGVGTYPQV